MKTKPTPPPATGQDRKAIEALAPALPDIFDALPDLVTEAGRIETARRRRTR